jgi:hypothetical protein
MFQVATGQPSIQCGLSQSLQVVLNVWPKSGHVGASEAGLQVTLLGLGQSKLLHLPRCQLAVLHYLCQ